MGVVPLYRVEAQIKPVDVLVVGRLAFCLKPEIDGRLALGLRYDHCADTEVPEEWDIGDDAGTLCDRLPARSRQANRGAVKKILIRKEGRASLTDVERDFAEARVLGRPTKFILPVLCNAGTG